jgi:hypothetical protein
MKGGSEISIVVRVEVGSHSVTVTVTVSGLYQLCVQELKGKDKHTSTGEQVVGQVRQVVNYKKQDVSGSGHQHEQKDKGAQKQQKKNAERNLPPRSATAPVSIAQAPGTGKPASDSCEDGSVLSS